MSKVARLIIYEGTNENLAFQLARSLPDGIRPGTSSCPSISVITIGITQGLEIFLGAKLKKDDGASNV